MLSANGLTTASRHLPTFLFIIAFILF